MSMFSCFPRNLSGVGIVGIDIGTDTSSRHQGQQQQKQQQARGQKLAFKVSILERHPYTTQTFSPLGLSAAGDDESTVFLVIVAPSLSSPASAKSSATGEDDVQIQNPPDLSRLRAFVARGGQAVTYGPGTWHAPMAVIGRRRVDFVVTQFVNGVADDDCQELLLGDNAVSVDLSALNLDLDSDQASRQNRAKL
jgi:ureidoglycolate lyase